MDESHDARHADWSAVDQYLVDALVHEDADLARTRESATSSTMPRAEVAPNQGKFLALLAQLIGARRVLEFGTLAGYSALWLAKAVGDDGHVTTLELDPDNAELARQNFARAGVSDRVRVLVGPAIESARRLIEQSVERYDLVFIDADKPSNPLYLEAALALTRPGSVIIGDNVVRDGQVGDANSADSRVQGTRELIRAMGSNQMLSATALQTVGSKGWDGFVLARVEGIAAQSAAAAV